MRYPQTQKGTPQQQIDNVRIDNVLAGEVLKQKVASLNASIQKLYDNTEKGQRQDQATISAESKRKLIVI
jgi:hypothetical protein